MSPKQRTHTSSISHQHIVQNGTSSEHERKSNYTELLLQFLSIYPWNGPINEAISLGPSAKEVVFS